MSRGITFEKEMAVTHREFFCALPRVLGTEAFHIAGTRIRVDDGDRSLEIKLSEQSERRLGAMLVPVTRVRLRFSGYGEDEAAEAVALFARHFQRCGG